MTGLFDGNHKIVGHEEILLVVRVLLVEAERIVAGNKFLVLGAKNAVRAGVPAVPLKLLGDDFDDGGILFAREIYPPRGTRPGMAKPMSSTASKMATMPSM